MRQNDPDNLLPGQWVDSFRVVKRLGCGSYGVVYQVEKEGDLFALKLARHRLASRDESHADARTQRELSCLLVLRHPHIARVWAHGRWPHATEGYFYLVMDFVEGFTLAQWAEETSPTAHELAVLGEKAAAALAHAHEEGIFHRDIKPDNIMVRSSDGEPVLVDYGAAAFPLGPALTDQRLPPGPPRYTTPEALSFDREHRGEPDARYEFKASDDIYALGVTLYDVLTVPRLHSNPKYLPVGSAVIPPKPASAVNERVPVALSELVGAMMARQPERRPVSMERVRRSFTEFTPLLGEEWKQRTLHPPSAQLARPGPLPPSPPPPPARRPRQLPRVRALAGAAGVLLVLALLALGALRQDEPVPAAPRPPLAPVSPTPETAPGASPAPLAPTPTAPAPAAPEARPLHPALSEERPTVTSSSPPSHSAEALCQRTKPPPRGSRDFRAWCKCAAVVGTLAATTAGCAGSLPPLTPYAGRCPQETVDTMERRLFAKEGEPGRWEGSLAITLVNEPIIGGRPARVGVGVDHVRQILDTHKEGPLTARVIRIEYEDSMRNVPVGSLLFGYLWLNTDYGPEYAMLRFNRVQTPDGKSYPVCMAGYEEDGLIFKREGSKPGAARLKRYGYVKAVWDEWPPPPGPQGDSER